MDIKDQIIQFIRINGPSLPVKISKEINTNILMASAHLSELSSNKKIKVSSLKVGGSPLYYLPGQEVSLQKFIENLNIREREAYNYLYQKKIVRDTELSPIQRVAIRAIKDFAIPINVNLQNHSELFWKWYLYPNNEAEAYIKSILEKKEEVKPIEKILEKQVILKETIKQPLKQEFPKKKQITDKTELLKKIYTYFNKNNIEIIEENTIRKTSEIDFTIKLPSAVGELIYLCKFKAKQKINEGDLSSAYLQSQTKKLPLIILTNGELTKKAKEMLEKELKGISVKKI